MPLATELLVWATVIHLVADWLLQNDWMADNKLSLRHPAAWVHGSIHALLLLLVFPPFVALLAGLIHLLIDTRTPVAWWMANVKQMKPGPHVPMVEMWLDQVFHIVTLAAIALGLAWWGGV